MNDQTRNDPGTEALNAIGVVDGRYRRQLASLAPIVSEAGLIRARVTVELAWFCALANEPSIQELPALTPEQQQQIGAIAERFGASEATRVKVHEQKTNHDVKAVEYFVKEALAEVPGLAPHTEFVHFACTSEDINNCAYALLLRNARDDVLLPTLEALRSELAVLATTHAAVPMLSRTHGQPATPSTVGKELRNLEQRLSRQLAQVAALEPLAKLNGAVGNYNAHRIAYPDTDWPALAARVLDGLKLTSNAHTTQIEPHDWIAELAHALIRVNTVLLDAARDFWSYISLDYFKQRPVAGETGSSTMPHKVNPIDFENAEGNIGVANALLDHFATKLPVSRLQRDLSDSTVLRNLGTAIGHSVIAAQAFTRGLGKLELNEQRLAADLDDNWEVLGEAVQTVMRRYGLEQPYERIKAATRGQRLDAAGYTRLLETLELPPAAHQSLAALTPATYLGLARELAAVGRSTDPQQA
ncbi:MAG: adenylosuccinate lyase [Pseudomonadota bacterium]